LGKLQIKIPHGDLFRQYSVTKFYLNLEARMNNVSNFQDDIEVSGSSFGIGFSFEYL